MSKGAAPAQATAAPPVPVTAVAASSLPPVPVNTSAPTPPAIAVARTPAPAEPAPLHTGSIAAPSKASAPASTSTQQTALVAVPVNFRALSDEDRDSVTSTLAQAMLDQERGATVPWLSDKSGHGGLIVPVASPIRQGDSLCRAVIVSITRDKATDWMQGDACKPIDADWRLLNLRAWRNPT